VEVRPRQSAERGPKASRAVGQRRQIRHNVLHGLSITARPFALSPDVSGAEQLIERAKSARRRRR